MGQEVVCLQPEFFGPLSFPHFLKIRSLEETKVVDVIIKEESDLNTGDLISMTRPINYKNIYQVLSIGETRKARGDWSAYEVWPLWAQIEVKYIGSI